MKRCYQNRGVSQNAYSLKLNSIRRAILYGIYSTKEPLLGFFLLNFQIDSALTFLGRLIDSLFVVSNRCHLQSNTVTKVTKIGVLCKFLGIYLVWHDEKNLISLVSR